MATDGGKRCVARTCAAFASVVLFAGVAWGDIESTPLGQPEPNPLFESDEIESRRIGASGEGAETPFAFAAYVETLLALGLVLGLAFGASVAVKKFAKTRGGLAGALGPGGPSPSGVLEILGRYPIGAGQMLVLLRFDTRVLLLHQVGGRKNPSMRTISEVVDADDVASVMMKTRDEAGDAVHASFQETIRKMERGFGEAAPARADAVSDQHQLDLLVGDGPTSAVVDLKAVRAKLRGWVGANA